MSRRFYALVMIGGLCCGFSHFAFVNNAAAESVLKTNDQSIQAQVDELNSQVKNKRVRVQQLDSLVDAYKKKIQAQEAKQSTLENEIQLLDDQIAKKQLDIEQTKTELEALNLEIQALAVQIQAQEDRLTRQKDEVGELIRHIHSSDGVSPLEVLLTQRSLSAFFDRLEEEKRLSRDLEDALVSVKNTKEQLETKKADRSEKKVAAEKAQREMKKEELALEAEKNLKTSLISETQSKQSEFERVIYELKQQQQLTTDEISTIESRLKEKLDTADEALARGDVLLNWPIDTSRGITARFHDASYPFRNLFEHPGVDVRASVGTPIRAAAGGYVAWNKKGRMYGNYVMIVHPGNIATVYAHLSRFVARPDTYVERGDIIGFTGGMPGMDGAGLSTGPHLHFEVRQNGIPVNPENFLPTLSDE